MQIVGIVVYDILVVTEAVIMPYLAFGEYMPIESAVIDVSEDIRRWQSEGDALAVLHAVDGYIA